MRHERDRRFLEQVAQHIMQNTPMFRLFKAKEVKSIAMQSSLIEYYEQDNIFVTGDESDCL